MKTKEIAKVLASLLFFLAGITAFGQQTSIKTMPTGNGPLLNGLKIDDVGIGGGHFSNLQNLGIGSMTKAEIVSKKVVVAIRYSGTITEYRYNGKTYKSSYSDGKCTVPSYHTTAVKATAKIQVGSQAHTISDNISQLLAESGNLILDLDKEVPVKDMKLLSVTLEPLPNAFYENELDAYLACLKKEKENKEKKKETSKTDDDFWNGSKKNSNKVAQNEKDDFWSGGGVKTKTLVLTTSNNDFWSGKEEKQPEPENKQDKTKEEEIKHDGYVYVRFKLLDKHQITGGDIYITNIFRGTSKDREMSKGTYYYQGHSKPSDLYEKLSKYVTEYLGYPNKELYDYYGDIMYFWFESKYEAEKRKNGERYIDYHVDGFHPYGK